MTRLIKIRIWRSFLLSFVLVFHVYSQTTLHPSSVNPYFIAIAGLEERVFSREIKEFSRDEELHEEKVKDTIMQIAAGYKTGLEKEDMGEISELILTQSRKYGYDPLFLTALIVTESSFNNWARSGKGALGLMQIKPKTGVAMAREVKLRWRGRKTLFDPEANIVLGSYYLNKLIKRFGDLRVALEAYNHGPTQISNYVRRGKLPKRYSGKVMNNYRRIRSKSI